MYLPRLKDLREDKDLNQEDIAKLLETDQSYYAKYENGKRPITVERLMILADFYNVSLDYITGRTNDKRGIGYAKSYKNTNIEQQNINYGSGTQINVKK